MLKGFNNVYTGSGGDTIDFSAKTTNYINTGAGNDTIDAGLGIDSVNGGNGNDLLIVNYSVGDTGTGMQIDYNGSYGSATRNMADTITPLDRIDFGNIERFNIIGTKRDDNIITGAVMIRSKVALGMIISLLALGMIALMVVQVMTRSLEAAGSIA